MVICKLPSAGLGNQLFPLIKAHIFARLNNQPIKIVGYNQWHPGAYIRGEKTKRDYRNYFTFQKSLLGEMFDKLSLIKLRAQYLEKELPLKKIDDPKFRNEDVVYSAIPPWNDFFGGLREHREMAKELIWELLRAEIKSEVANLSTPCIGIHIRMGDFRKLKENEDFKKVGQVRTPELYFIDVVQKIRAMHGSVLPVTVFTDGHRREFSQLFNIENIHLSEGNTDITDMLLLSKSSIIVTSAGSTFSYWSGFFSDSPIIMHPDHIHSRIRMAEEKGLYEGPLNFNDALLESCIKSIPDPKIAPEV